MANVLAFLKAAAPWLEQGLQLAGPPGNLAAAALGRVLAIKNPTRDAITTALQTAQLSGDQILALKAEEDTYRKTMQEMGFQELVQLEQIAAADRADARQLEIKSGDKWTPRLLLIFICAIWLAVNGFILWNAYRPEAGAQLTAASAQMVGSISKMADAALTLALGYYWGSSTRDDRRQVLDQMASASAGQGA